MHACEAVIAHHVSLTRNEQLGYYVYMPCYFNTAPERSAGDGGAHTKTALAIADGMYYNHF
jgi:hypothetical protein